LTSTQAATYQWYKDNTLIGGATSQTYVAPQSGSYTVAVTDGSGCSATSSAANVIITDIKNVADDAGFSISPNPVASGFVEFRVGASLVGSEYKIFDLGEV